MNWTKMQEQAVLSPVSDILVTAAAGSGKTQVLTGRILNRITNENADISRMLVMTFTNAAASEMRERISKKISEVVSQNPKNRHLRKQLALVETADISTIHSFCLKLLRSYFYAIDIDPSFKIAEGTDINILRAEALSEALDFYYENEDENFSYTVDTLCSAKNDSAILDYIDDLWKFAESDPFPEKWLNDAKNKYNSLSSEESFSFYTDILIKKATDYLILSKENLREAICIANEDEGLEKYSEVFSHDLYYIESVLKKDISWDNLYNSLSYSFERCPVPRKNANPYLKEASKNKRDAAKRTFDFVKSLITMNFTEAHALTESMKIQVSSLIDVTKKAMELFFEKKKEKNILDFSDLEHLTIKILTNPNSDETVSPSEIAYEIRDKYDEIYVDEYQDTNEIQETIIQMISSETKGNPNIFMVGDMKQSIYKFRMTNPKKIFGEKASRFVPFENKTKEDKHIKISLSQNFRSRKEILDAVNSVFDRLMSKKAGEIEYKGDERLLPGSESYKEPTLTPAMNLNILAMPSATLAEESRKMQGEFLAKKIKELMKSNVKVYDKALDSFRPLEYRDIAVLLRSPKSHGIFFENALSNENIPYFSVTDSSFFEYTEIQLLLSFLRIIDNPLQDIDLIAVLRSPVFSFDENELALLALKKKSYLYEAIKEAAEDENSGKKCRYFLAKLNLWRKESSFLSVSAFLEFLLGDINYLSFVGAMSHAEAHLENIDLFLNAAKKAEDSSFRGLFDFLQYMERISLSGESTSPSSSLSDSINSVRIMSIHKSKGLEFPFVFLCAAESDFNLKDLSKPMLLHKDLGIGIDGFSNPYGQGIRKKVSLPIKDLIKETMTEETLSEELRILYVALTRAREHIEVIGSVNLKKDLDHYILPENNDVIYPEDVLSRKNYLDWLLLVSGNNENIGINVINCLAQEESDEKVLEIAIPEPLPCTEDISKILEFEYPYLNIKSVKNKYSVSELKHSSTENAIYDAHALYHNHSPSLPIPAFLNETKLFTSAQKGSIMHYALEHLDIHSKNGKDAIKTLNLTEKEISALDISSLDFFLRSDLADRMRKSGKLYKEAPFTLKENLSSITKREDDDAEVLIQGIIDCYFFENDKIILLDYKTDNNVTEEKLKERYETQLSVYARALQQRYKMPVAEKIIYSFYLNKTIYL